MHEINPNLERHLIMQISGEIHQDMLLQDYNDIFSQELMVGLILKTSPLNGNLFIWLGQFSKSLPQYANILSSLKVILRN